MNNEELKKLVDILEKTLNKDIGLQDSKEQRLFNKGYKCCIESIKILGGLDNGKN